MVLGEDVVWLEAWLVVGDVVVDDDELEPHPASATPSIEVAARASGRLNDMGMIPPCNFLARLSRH